MRAAIGIYDTHDEALDAINKLNEAGFPVTHLSIMGRLDTEVVDKNLNLSTEYPLKLGGIEAGTTLGITLGVLTGVGILAIPGLGFIYGAGAVAGAVAGFDAGLVGGGLGSVVETLVSKSRIAKKYKSALEEGKYLLLVKASHSEVDKAKEILSGHEGHQHLEVDHDD